MVYDDNTLDLYASFNETSVLRDARWKGKGNLLFSDSNLELLRRKKVINNYEGWDQYQANILRILINPDYETQLMIDSVILQLHNYYSVGVHIRVDGDIADNHECIQFMKMSMIEKIPKRN